MRESGINCIEGQTALRDTLTMRCPKCEIELPTVDWHAVSHMWNCGFTMSQAIANYERLLVHHMDRACTAQSLDKIPFLAS